MCSRYVSSALNNDQKQVGRGLKEKREAERGAEKTVEISKN